MVVSGGFDEFNKFNIVFKEFSIVVNCAITLRFCATGASLLIFVAAVSAAFNFVTTCAQSAVADEGIVIGRRFLPERI